MQSELRLAGAVPRAAAPPYRASGSRQLSCRQVRSPQERDQHVDIRHRIFVTEQEVFTDSDLDAHDQDGSAIALLGFCDDVPAGTVRLFVLDPGVGLWQGDRLAVLAPYRTLGLGAPLVRCAVATAAALGGRRMSAHIQPANVPFFERLGWTKAGGTELYAGLLHQPMDITLPSRDEGTATVHKLANGINARDR